MFYQAPFLYGTSYTRTAQQGYTFYSPLYEDVDWADILQPGGGSWNLDLDGDGINEVTLDALNLEGKVSIEIASTRVEIEAHIGGGVYVGIGDFKVGRDANGNLSFQLPDFIAGTDGLLRFHISKPKAAYDAAVDLNRDGAIEFDKSDATATNDPYAFWVNNDHDRGGIVDLVDFEEDDHPTGSIIGGLIGLETDAEYPNLQWKRDLEDLSRIWLDLEEFSSMHSLADTSISLRVRIKESKGQPSVNLFKAVEGDGGREYLSDESVGDAQLDANLSGGYGIELCRASHGTTARTVPRRAWESPPSSKIVHLLFEGEVEGEGELLFHFEKNGQTIYSFDPIYLKLQDVEDMYETWTVGDVGPPGIVSSAWPAAAATQSGGSSLPPPDPNRPAELDYIMFVHGWNMAPWEKEAFASTMFKRLWHQGYKGRFGAFRWPTLHSFNFLLPWQADHFNLSEERAWFSAEPLANLVSQLSIKHRDPSGSRVRLYAHSMGNVVASEALRLSGSGDKVHTYISAQAALSAHVWDKSRADKPGFFGLPANTPNVYGYYWKPGETNPPHLWESANNLEYMNQSYMPIGTRYINHFNTVDWALAADKWQVNQELKPDGGYGYFAPSFQKIVMDQWQDIGFPSNRYEIFSYAAESHSKATGADGGPGGLFSSEPGVDLNGPQFAFGSAHKGHSGQFRSTIQKRWPYWVRFMSDMELNYP